MFFKRAMRKLALQKRSHRVMAAVVALLVVVAGGLLIQSAVRSSPLAGPEPGVSTSENPSISATQAPAPSASPTLKPSLSPSPSKKPQYDGFPSPSNTGWRHTGVKLKTKTSRVYAEKKGQVLDGWDFRDGIVVTADNVTIKRSRIQCGNCPGIWVDWDVKNTVIEDVEVTSKSKTERIDRGITVGRTWNTTIRRAYVHDTQRGIEYGYSATIEHSYIDDQYNPTAAHVSAIGGDTNPNFKLTIRHNWIAGKPGQNNSGAMLFYPGPEPGDHKVQILIEDNMFNGGTYALWLSSDDQLVGTLTVRNNKFGTKYHDSSGFYGPYFVDDLLKPDKVDFIWKNNTWYAPGKAKHGTQVVLKP